MKKILFTAVSALAIGVALAADSTQFGVLRVPSSLKKTIVSVPWLESGTGTQNVTISNLVLTADLEVGDLLKYYNGSGYTCWRLAEGAGNVKYWQSVVMDNGQGDYVPTGNPAETTVARGKAIILDRCGGDNTRKLSGFYIMGKPCNGDAEIILPASKDAPVYSLIAPPSVDADGTAINGSKLTWENIEKGDRLVVNTDTGTKYYGWSRVPKSDPGTYNWADQYTGKRDGVIPCGEGMWFVSTTNTTTVASKKVTWINN